MSSPVLTIGIEDDIGRADALMREHAISAVLVLGREGVAAGVISRRDLLRAGRIMTFARRAGERHLLELPTLAAADLMNRPVMAVTPSEPIVNACVAMVERRIHRVFVLDDGKPVGVLSTRDVMSAVREGRLDTTLAALIRGRDVISIQASKPISEAMDTLEKAGVGGLVVLDGNTPIGMFTEREALEARGRPPGTQTEDVMTAAMLCLPSSTPLFRAAAFGLATTARRILVTDKHKIRGIVTGIDFAGAIAESAPDPDDGLAAG